MELDTLRELGLSPNEAKIYHALLTYGGSGASTISLRAKVHRRNAYDALQRLLLKGLVAEVFGHGETVFEPVEPGKLNELVHEKQLKLDIVLPSLRKLYHEHRSSEHAYTFKGIEGVKNYLRLALRSGQDMFVLGGEGEWLDPRLETYTMWFLEEARKKKMQISTLFEADILTLPGAPELLSTRYKIFPKKYETQSTMHIFGDTVVTYTGTYPGKLLDDVSVFIIQSPKLAESYRVWWKLVWDMLPGSGKKGKSGRKKLKM